MRPKSLQINQPSRNLFILCDIGELWPRFRAIGVDRDVAGVDAELCGIRLNSVTQ